VEAYLRDIIAACTGPDEPLVSLVLFGSAATGGYAAGISDVDLLVIVADHTTDAEQRRVRDTIAALERSHGLAKPRSGGWLDAFADRITANLHSFFVCTRADLLSGEPARILGIPVTQAVFVDRVAVPSIVASGTTVCGEDLLPRVSLRPVRRLDVGKAFFGLFNQVLFSAAAWPLLPGATRYAMDALKRSVHNCFFCRIGRAAPLAEEVAFFEAEYGPSPTLQRLLELRRDGRPSLPFVLRCMPALALLHGRTARDFGKAPSNVP
jgi:hypothetical protein